MTWELGEDWTTQFITPLQVQEGLEKVKYRL